MICPHCNQMILRRERVDSKCAKCGRVFALEPKELPIALHDVRVRKLAEKLRGPEGYVYTYTQMRYAAVRNRIETSLESDWRITFIVTAGVIVFITFVPTLPLTIGLGGAFGLSAGSAVAWVLGTGFTLAVLSMIVNWLRKPGMVRNHRIVVGMSDEEFAARIGARWRAVYRADLPGGVNERTAALVQSPTPRAAVLCADRSVLVCLSWNAIAQSRELMFAAQPQEIPPQIPVLVIHDASPLGLRQWDEARRVFGARAVDVGLSARTALDGERFIWLREPQLSDEAEAALPSYLTDDERRWLATGWWSPVAAIPPGRLITTVDRAIGDLDPVTAAARRTGFLTWPAA